MTSHTSVQLIATDPELSPALRGIAQKVLDGQRITPEEGILLYEEASLSYWPTTSAKSATAATLTSTATST